MAEEIEEASEEALEKLSEEEAESTEEETDPAEEDSKLEEEFELGLTLIPPQPASAKETSKIDSKGRFMEFSKKVSRISCAHAQDSQEPKPKSLQKTAFLFKYELILIISALVELRQSR